MPRHKVVKVNGKRVRLKLSLTRSEWLAILPGPLVVRCHRQGGQWIGVMRVELAPGFSGSEIFRGRTLTECIQQAMSQRGIK
jgi:hypothetical protein